MNLDTAISKAGSINALAAILCVTRQAIQGMRRSGGEIPAARIEQLRKARPEWFLRRAEPGPSAPVAEVAGR